MASKEFIPEQIKKEMGVNEDNSQNMYFFNKKP
jgi:hypothetical protein